MLTFAVTAAVTQMVPILTEIGLPRGTAVSMTSVAGLGLVLGRLFGGYSIDRVFAPRVYAAICIIASVGLFALATGRSELALVACFLIGIAGGTEIDLLAYLVSRYFGALDYGKIYGWQWGASLAGSIVSPIAVGYLSDLRDGYGVALIVSTMLALAASLLSFSFGEYPIWKNHKTAISSV
jgi:MFS family permease